MSFLTPPAGGVLKKGDDSNDAQLKCQSSDDEKLLRVFTCT